MLKEMIERLIAVGKSYEPNERLITIPGSVDQMYSWDREKGAYVLVNMPERTFKHIVANPSSLLALCQQSGTDRPVIFVGPNGICAVNNMLQGCDTVTLPLKPASGWSHLYQGDGGNSFVICESPKELYRLAAIEFGEWKFDQSAIDRLGHINFESWQSSTVDVTRHDSKLGNSIARKAIGSDESPLPTQLMCEPIVYADAEWMGIPTRPSMTFEVSFDVESRLVQLEVARDVVKNMELQWCEFALAALEQAADLFKSSDDAFDPLVVVGEPSFDG